jgi:hypothetical protein
METMTLETAARVTPYFLSNLGLRLGLAIDDGQITLRAHRGLAGLRVGEGLQETDRCLIPEGSACPVAVLLRVPLASRTLGRLPATTS